MNVKRIVAKTSREAMRQLREVLGPDAVILSNRAVDGGVEVHLCHAGLQPRYPVLEHLARPDARDEEHLIGERRTGVLCDLSSWEAEVLFDSRAEHTQGKAELDCDV